MEKITKGSGFFSQWPNFSAELSEKEIPELATPKYIFRLNLTERMSLLVMVCYSGDKFLYCWEFHGGER
jgi:hypothetical protein